MLKEKERSGCKGRGTGVGDEDGDIWGRKAQLCISFETSFYTNRSAKLRLLLVKLPE